MPPYYSVFVLLALAWGSFAFGAVYDWAYPPLLWACAALGLLGLASPGAEGRRPVAWPVAGALALLGLGVVAQLLPLAPGSIARVSPAAHALLQQRDLAYALAAGSPAVSYRHPLSIDPQGTWLGLAGLAAFGLLLLGAARALGRRALTVLASGLAAIGLLLALTGIIQSGLGVRDREATGLIYGFWKPIWGTNPFGPFVNRNHFAGWMLMALPVVVGYFIALVARGMRGAGPTLRHRVLWFSTPAASRVVLVGLAAAVMAISLVLTFSRSGILGFMLALGVSAAFVLRNAGPAERPAEGPAPAADRRSREAAGSRDVVTGDRGRRLGTQEGIAPRAAAKDGARAAEGRSPARVAGTRRRVAVCYIALLGVLAIGWAGIDAVAERFAAAEGTRLNGRLPIWEDTARVIRDFPIFGTGLGTYGAAMEEYQVWEPQTRTLEAHNDYLQLAAEGGILLGLPALLVIGVLAREIRRRFREDREGQVGAPGRGDITGYWLRVGATTGLLAIGLQETVEFSLQVPGNAALFVVVAAIALHPPSLTPPSLTAPGRASATWVSE